MAELTPDLDYHNSSNYKLSSENTTPFDIENVDINSIKEKLDLEYNLNTIQKSNENKSFFPDIFKCFDEKPFLFKIYLILFFQFSIIIILAYLGFKYNVADKFINDGQREFYIFCATTLIISFMCYTGRCVSRNNKKVIYTCYCLYIICIDSYCFLIFDFTKSKNILIILWIILLDIISLMVYTFIRYELCELALSLIIINIIDVPIFSLIFLKDESNNIITISILSVGFIIYFFYISFAIKEKRATWWEVFQVAQNEYLYGVLLFNLTLFIPVAYIVFIILVILFLLLVLYMKSNQNGY